MPVRGLALAAAIFACGPAFAQPSAGAAEGPKGPVAALGQAACDGRAGKVADAVRRGVDPNGAWIIPLPGDDAPLTFTPLVDVIFCKNLAGARALLDAGADPNRATPDGETPVSAASKRVDATGSAILALLLSRGGDPNAHDGRHTALESALSAGAGQEFRGAKPEQAWANWQALLDAGADVNRRDPLHSDIMFAATSEDRYDKVVRLLDLGYRGDPVVLGRYLTMYLDLVDRMPAASVERQRPWVDQVKAYLAQRKVKLPVPPLVQMKKDAAGNYIQP